MISRYTLPEMGEIWSQRNKYECWKEVEVACMRAWARRGVGTSEAADRLERDAEIRPDRIKEIEDVVRHDVIAFVSSLSEQVEEAAGYLHYGLTSSDVLDTALGLQLRAAGELILTELSALIDAVARRAREHRETVMMGRTHGVHAEPTTLGLKLALWYEELLRGRNRLEAALEEVATGKISGATGTYAQVPPDIEVEVCDELGLTPAPVSSQIIGRDRHAAFLSALAQIGGLLEKFAVEIRGLQRTEIRELEEPFRTGQKGSSAMPHKRNPIVTERITGMARLLRGNLLAGLENVALWHERDISHSSVERVILPDSTTILHYMLRRMSTVVSDLVVNADRMRQNMDITGGAIYSQRVLLALVDAGMARDEAYSLVQAAAMDSLEGEASFRDLIRTREEVREILDEEDLQRCFDPTEQLGHVDEIFERLGLI
ncbi:MAG: adenylosuccinate lyase [Bacillota bacterium]